MARECYASSLGNCSGGLSREHYISRDLINLGQPDPKRIWLGGPLDIGHATSAKNLANAKVLCKHHNEALSHLDSEYTRLAALIFAYNQEGGTHAETFDGAKVTLWHLKYLFGFLAAGRTRLRHEHLPEGTLEEFVPILFEREALPDWVGFSVPHSAQVEGFPSIIMRDGGFPPYAHIPRESPTVQGVKVTAADSYLYPLRLRVSLQGIPMFGHERYRPALVTMRSSIRGSSLQLRFSWPEGFRGGTVIHELG